MRYILRNICLCLLENNKLIAGNSVENNYSYYELFQLAIIGNLHNVNLIVYVAIKTAEQHFRVYKIIAFPKRIGKDNFVLYQFSVFCNRKQSVSLRLVCKNRLTMMQQNSITVRQVNTAFYAIQTITCVTSLYFQTRGENKPCRSILLHHNTRTLQRHGTVWIFHFPQRTQVNIVYPQGTKNGIRAPRVSSTQALFTPRHVPSPPARFERYPNYTAP